MEMEMEMESFFRLKGSGSGSGSGSESEHKHIALVSGPASCGKSSLVFQYAINCAMEHEDSFVLFISLRRGGGSFVSQVVDIDPSSPVLQRIRIKYLDDHQGIINFFAAFHLHRSFPCAVVVDDFSHFFHQTGPRPKQVAMLRTLALCHNAIMHADGCKLVLSDTHTGDSPTLLFLYRPWVSSIFTITAHGPGCFTLKSHHHQHSKIAKYSIAPHNLTLDTITSTTLASSNL